MRALVTIALLAPAAVQAQEFSTLTYVCDRGVSVPATYMASADQSVVVLNVEGRQITLVGEPSASGTRYGWPSGGSSYVWQTMDGAATLHWKTPDGETLLLTCKVS